MMTYSEMQIRDRAYALWEAAGRPDGQDKEFWAMAEQELAEHQDHDDEEPAPDPVSAAVAGGLPTR